MDNRMEKERINAAIYIRTVPLLDQSQESQSAVIQEYANRLSYSIVAHYHDESFGGINERRPALECLIVDAKEQKFEVVLVLSLDRVFRHSKHLVSVVNELSRSGVGLVSIQDGFDSSSEKGQEALQSVLQILSLDRRMQNERIRIGIAQKKMAAELTASRWRVGRPQISNDLIEQIITLRSQGLSIRAIERRLKRVVSKTTLGRIIKSTNLRSIKAD